MHDDRPLGLRRAIHDLAPSKIGEVAATAFGDASVIPLWFGEGDLSTPDFVGKAAVEALARGETFYTWKRGIPRLREAIARYLSDLHGVAIGADRVMVTTSGMSAIMLTVQTLVDPGDNIVIVSPVWPNIATATEAIGGEARLVGLDPTPEGAWKLDIDRLFAACDGRTRALFVNSPSNPTGWMMSRAEGEAILAEARKRGLWIMADEVYQRIVYDTRVAPSFLELAEPEDRVVSLNSFSKTWAMTGWRLGWMVAPAAWNPIMDKMIEINTSGAPAFLQPAALAAIQQGEAFAAEFIERCRQGREIVLQGLSRYARVRLARPAGAFYAFMAVDGMTDSLAVAKEIVARCKVGLAPGIAFGRAGEGYLRLCFASSARRLEEAVDRLAPVLG